MKRISIVNLIILAVILLVGAAIFVLISDDDTTTRTDANTSTKQEELPEPEVIEEPEVETTFLEPGELDCTEGCWLAPVDKDHSLPSSYIPTVEATGLSGGRELTPEAAEALRDIFTAASSDGISLGVISGYRSYSYQDGLFSRYVEEEKAKGLSQAEAEAEANTYSAKPGTSEHQLGTTADIGCVGCAFEESQANLDAWAWLANNAPKYGYVLSYPEGRSNDTGYIYEPWHWRFIGIENAAMYESQSELTLNRWLAQVPSPAS